MDPGTLLSRWNAWPRAARSAIVAGGALVLALSIAGGIIAHPQRTMLFSSKLYPEQLSEVEERLAGWNVAFTPVADNLLVDPKRRSDLLLRLSLAGVPHAHVDASSDVLNKLGALTPQAVIDAQTRDGLSGDIELGLRGITGVQDARVIIAPAKAGYFADESSRDASASVRLRLIAGTQLSQDAVSGIRAFVAASVPGLEAKRVTILDDRGVALGEGQSESDGSELQRSLQSALDTAVGAGVSIVRVHLEYDRRTSQTSDERRVPAGSVAISANTQHERYDGAGKRYDRADEQLDRGSETHQTTTSIPSGRIARISAAVFIDAARAVDLYQVRLLAAATLGIDAHRGDTLDVEAIPFTHSIQAKRDGWWLAYGAIVPVLPALVTAIAVLLGLRWSASTLAALARSLSERIRMSRPAGPSPALAPTRVRGALANEPPHAAAAIISALPAATAAAVLDLYPESERAAILRRMQRSVSPLLGDAESFIGQA